MRVVRLIWTLGLLAIVLAGCFVPHPPCDLSALNYPSAESLSGSPLRLGIIDASNQFPFELPQPLKQTQASLAVLDDVRWGFIEPEPPQNDSHIYEWDDEIVGLDTRVQAYQAAGFELIIVLRAWNTWARAVSPQGGKVAAAASTSPRSEYLADYATWVQAVVERYDGDGLDDFPGLVDGDGDGKVDPVRYYQIETDAVSGVWWQGTTPESTTAEYLTLLEVAEEAVHSASPEARVLLAGIPAFDLLDGFPTTEGLRDVVENIDPSVCGAIGAYTELLQAKEAYDIATVSSAADYSGLLTLSHWIPTLAGEPVEVWITGATSAPALTADPVNLSVNPWFPPGIGLEIWESLQNEKASDHDTVERWYRAEQARLAVKKWVYAAWSGFDVLTMGLEQDRPLFENPDLGRRDLAFQGMLDQADGMSSPEPRPVIAALALVQGQLSGYTSVRRLSGLEPGIEAFEFMVAGLPVYVFWYEDGIPQAPDDPPATTMLTLPVRGTQLTALTTPTERGQHGPGIETLIPSNGMLTFNVTETPLVLRGEWAALFLPIIQR